MSRVGYDDLSRRDRDRMRGPFVPSNIVSRSYSMDSLSLRGGQRGE